LLAIVRTLNQGVGTLRAGLGAREKMTTYAQQE
jgi:hypothetical protein